MSDNPATRFPRLAATLVKLQLNVEVRKAVLEAIDADLSGPAPEARRPAGPAGTGSWDTTLDALGIARRPEGPDGEEYR